MDVVTGAFGYTGKYITQRLLSIGRKVRTLTGHPNRENPFGERVRAVPFNFDNPTELTNSLRGAATLYNTYWLRFDNGHVTFDNAVENSKTLFNAAEAAGIRRIVHISITSASEDSPLPYFRGKGIVEKAIINSNLSYSIIRPTVIFGTEDILINNIAWFLRRFPLFTIFGAGDYRLQPVYVGDVADIAVRAASEDDHSIIDAVGPETYTFEQLVRLIADRVHSRAKMIHLSRQLALYICRLAGFLVRDVVLTRDEVEGLMSSLLVSEGPPLGQTRLSNWLDSNARALGIKYTSELNRHYR